MIQIKVKPDANGLYGIAVDGAYADVDDAVLVVEQLVNKRTTAVALTVETGTGVGDFNERIR